MKITKQVWKVTVDKELIAVLREDGVIILTIEWGEVTGGIRSDSVGAGLTPAQARELAAELVAIADRSEKMR